MRAFSLLFVLAFGASCAPGELALETGTGGAAASGGAGGTVTVDAAGGSASGGADVGFGEGGSVPPPPPCFVTGFCPTDCTRGGAGCLGCDTSGDCGGPFPVCDRALGFCVECIDDADCEARFGDPYDECSAGRCVACQKDEDCMGDDRCFGGLCGECFDSDHCPNGEVCLGGRCEPG